MTAERFEKVLPEIEKMEMRVSWGDGYTYLPTYLPVLVELYRVYGRRCGEFRRFRRNNVRLMGESDAPEGELIIPREFSKQDERDRLALTASTRRILRDHINRMVEIMSDLEEGVEMPLFPAPTDPSRPVGYATIRQWYVNAEENAGLKHRDQGGFHEFRRWYATKMKDIPDQDEVAEIAGWKDQYSMRTHGYTQTESKRRRSVIEESEAR